MSVIVQDETVAVTVQDDTVVVVTVAEQGPPGIPGDAPTITAIAGIAIGGHRLVVFASDGTLTYADSTIADHAERLLGLSTHAAGVGTSLTIQTGGELSEPSWNWDIGLPIYCGTNGLLTQVLPVTGFIQQVAIPLSATRIKLLFNNAFFLE